MNCKLNAFNHENPNLFLPLLHIISFILIFFLKKNKKMLTEWHSLVQSQQWKQNNK